MGNKRRGYRCNKKGKKAKILQQQQQQLARNGNVPFETSGEFLLDPNVTVPWNRQDRDVLLRYLRTYRKGTLEWYEGIVSCVDDDDDEDVESGKTRKDNRSGRCKKNKKPIRRRIGTVDFPELTDDVYRRPYLTLPTELTSKQRKEVHELCVLADLYHSGVGELGEDRRLVVSPYVDGFDHVRDLKRPPRIGMHRYRPWYYRRDGGKRTTNAGGDANAESSDRSTQATAVAATPKCTYTNVPGKVGDSWCFHDRAIGATEALIDQPGDCLRESYDCIDFERLEGLSLSDIEPPRCTGDGDGTSDDWMLVDSRDKMIQCIEELQRERPREIAFDLEAYNRAKYSQLTCLLQLASSRGRGYVIDVLAPGVWDEVCGLRTIFADPDVVKIGHAIAGLDVKCLHRDFGIYVVNAFDTYEAARSLKLKSHGLAHVCRHYGLSASAADAYEDLKSRYQACDWRERPLTSRMIQYGRYDVHFLVRLRRLMMRDLCNVTRKASVLEEQAAANALADTLKRIQQAEGDCTSDEEWDDRRVRNRHRDDDDDVVPVQDDHENFGKSREGCRVTKSALVDPGKGCEKPGSNQGMDDFWSVARMRLQPQLMTVISRSQYHCRSRWTGVKESYLQNGTYQAAKRMTDWYPETTTLYDELVRWREGVANELECLPAFVAPLEFLVPVAYKYPVDDLSLQHVTYFLPEVLEESREYREQLYDIIRKSLKINGIVPVACTHYYYAVAEDKANEMEERRRRRQTHFQLSWPMVAVAVTAGTGALLAVLYAKQRRR